MNECINQIFFDTETTNLLNANDELVSFPYILGFTTGNGEMTPVWWTNIESVFCKKIEEMLKSSESKTITLIGFNIYYDISVVLPFFNRLWNGKVNFFLDEKKSFIFGDYKILIDDIEYTIVLEDLWIFNRNMSVKKWADELGENNECSIDYDKWGLVKIVDNKIRYRNREGEYKTFDLQDELNYLESDVLILPKIKKYIDNFKKTIVAVTGVDESRAAKLKIKPGLTSASFAKYISSLKMHRNFDDCLRPTVNEKTYKLYTRSFMGGYTVGNKNIHVLDFGKNKYKMTAVDVNSMYPSVFADKLPLGRLRKTRKSSTDLEWLLLSTKEMKLKEQYSFLTDLPVSAELLDGEVWLCPKRLYDALCKVCESEIKVVSRLYTESMTEISTMIKVLYRKRKQKGIDKLTDFSIKTFLNSLYGKTCEKTHIKHHIINNTGIHRIINERPNFRGILPGIYIAGQARARLLEGIVTCVEKDKNIPVYCDTDSIIFIEVNPTSLDIGEELGQWKIEGRYNFFSRPLMKKKYLLEGIDSKGNKGVKLAVSGFDRNMVLNVMTEEQRRLLFSPHVNILWRRAKKYNTLNTLNQIIIDQIDVQTNEAIPVTHELIYKDSEFVLIKYDKRQ